MITAIKISLLILSFFVVSGGGGWLLGLIIPDQSIAAVAAVLWGLIVGSPYGLYVGYIVAGRL